MGSFGWLGGLEICLEVLYVLSWLLSSSLVDPWVCGFWDTLVWPLCSS